MRTLTVYYTDKRGGFCKRLYRLLSGAAARGNEVHYLTLDAPPSSLDAAVKVHLIPFPLKQRSGLLFWALFTAWCPLYSVVAAVRIQPQRYIVFGAYYSCMLLLARAVRPAPLALLLRSLVFRIDHITGKGAVIRRIAAFVEWLGMATATEVICMTKQMREEVGTFLGKDLGQSKLLPNNVPDLEANLPKRDRPFLISAVPRLRNYLQEHTLLIATTGVLDERKNISLLLTAIDQLHPEFSPSDLFLIVAGEGPLLKRHLTEIKRKGIEHVGFCGWLDSTFPLYRSVDLILHPSIHEGMPNSVLEPLGLGLPVLAANIPEMRELLQEPDLLFDPYDPADLSGKLRELLNNPSKLASLRELSQGAAVPYRFNWEDRACRLLDLDLN